MKPSLVLDEQVATGVCRFEFYGNVDVCREHLHAARVHLGEMRTVYGVNDRIAQGEGGGFYHQWRQLPRAVLHAITNDGQDIVRIYAVPPPPKPAPTRLPEPLEFDQYAVCGYAVFLREGFSSGNLHAWVWKPGAPAVTEIPGPSGARAWWANAISGDGRVVVGGWIDENSGLQRGYRWSKAAGAQDLGSLYEGDDAPVGEATGVNMDGSVVVGSGPNSNDSEHCVCWVWRAGSLTELVASGSNHSAGAAQKVAVSPNGKFIFGTVLRTMPSQWGTVGGTGGGSGPEHWELFYADVPRSALWHGGVDGYAGPTLLPEPGTVQIVVTQADSNGVDFFGGTRQVEIPYSIGPGEVADNGTVCGHGPFAVRCTIDGEIDLITPPGSTQVGEVINHVSSFGPDGEVSGAVAITADGGKVAGTLAEGSFTWTRDRLRRGAPSGTALVAGMSYDGTCFCGNSAFRPSDDGSWSDPLYWAKDRETVIPAMSGAVQTTATDVASNTVSLPPTF